MAAVGLLCASDSEDAASSVGLGWLTYCFLKLACEVYRHAVAVVVVVAWDVRLCSVFRLLDARSIEFVQMLLLRASDSGDVVVSVDVHFRRCCLPDLVCVAHRREVGVVLGVAAGIRLCSHLPSLDTYCISWISYLLLAVSGICSSVLRL